MTHNMTALAFMAGFWLGTAVGATIIGVLMRIALRRARRPGLTNG